MGHMYSQSLESEFEEEFFSRKKAPAVRVLCDHNEGPLHDCAYVDARDSLIPLAANASDQDHPPLPPEASREEHAARDTAWDVAFHRNMRLLAAELLGVRS